MWLDVIYHVINEQEWIFPYRLGAVNPCQHGPLTEEQEGGWIEAGSPARLALRNIVLEKRLLKKIQYYLNCRYDMNTTDFILEENISNINYKLFLQEYS